MSVLILLFTALASSLLPAAGARGQGDGIFLEAGRLVNGIYAGSIGREESAPRLEALRGRILHVEKRGGAGPGRVYAFPMKGYSFRQSDDGQGRGYVGAESYDFLDGNAHKGHPALDLFVYDRNQDCLDDRTKKPVDALAVTDGIVLCTFDGWDSSRVDAKGRMLRGGNQVYLYSPADEGIWYYAHLLEVLVKPGDRVRSGDRLGTVGRTGANARQRRSPTHLHIMLLDWRHPIPVPLNPYAFLKRTR